MLKKSNQQKALVLLSGGIDSSVASIVALQTSNQVYFLTFNYRQINRKEISCARQIAKALAARAPHIVVPLDFRALESAKRSHLLSPNIGSYKHSYRFYVPGRNMIFLAHAAAIAEVNDIHTIYLGSNLQDALHGSVGYPDSDSTFFRFAERAINRGLKYGNIQITAPLLGMNKFEAIRLGKMNNFDFRLTWSCYRNGRAACGKCPACRARILNFHWAGYRDPIRYSQGFESALCQALSR
jgi:7-cyano-7-deazaguanine synthase